MSLILDTGPIVALIDASDPEHDACVEMVGEVAEDLVIPSPVLVEVNYWLCKLFGVETWKIFVEDLERGAYRLLVLDEESVMRAAEIEEQYAALELGFVDASVIAMCERLGETKVASLDRRDFAAVRPRHCDALQILPA